MEPIDAAGHTLSHSLDLTLFLEEMEMESIDDAGDVRRVVSPREDVVCPIISGSVVMMH